MIRKILVWAVESYGGGQSWFIRGLPEAPIKGLDLADIKLKADKGIECRHVGGGEWKELEINVKDGWSLYAGDVEDIFIDRLKPLDVPEKGPVIAMRDARSVFLKRTHAPEETDIFLRVAGTNSKEIPLQKCDTRDAKQPIKLEDGAPAGAVTEEP